MLHFLIVKNHLQHSEVNLTPEFKRLSDYIPNGNRCHQGRWISTDGKTQVLYWIDHNPNFKDDFYVSNSKECLRLFNGWTADGWPVSSSLQERTKASNTRKIEVGEFLDLQLNDRGEGSLVRNLAASIQVYYCSNSSYSIISNRASLVNALHNRDKPFRQTVDPEYLSWMLSTSWALDNSTLFTGVKILRQGDTMRFNSEGTQIREEPGDIWYNDAYRSLYHSNPQRYWDECYDQLIANLDLLFESFNNSFEFPVSGGKDSRLLLALIGASKGKKLIRQIVTNGPPYSGEVVVGKLVADSLQIPHRFNDSEYVGASFDKKIQKHLFLTEAEVSPMDLCWNYAKHKEGMVLRGQESGLRNISDEVSGSLPKIKAWFGKHFNDFNRGGLVSERHAKRKVEWFESHIQQESAKVEDLNDLPTKNRLETRFLRWGARIWTVHNTNEFSPFLFLDAEVIRHTYSAGALARSAEEFHFEMLKRANSTLLTIPFFREAWNRRYGITTAVVSHYRTDKKPLRGSHAILRENWSAIKKYLMREDSRDLLGDIVNWKALENLEEAGITRGSYQPLWQLFQASMLGDIESFQESSLLGTAETGYFPTLNDFGSGMQGPENLEKMKSQKYGAILLEMLAEKSAPQTKAGTGKSALYSIFKRNR